MITAIVFAMVGLAGAWGLSAMTDAAYRQPRALRADALSKLARTQNKRAVVSLEPRAA